MNRRTAHTTDSLTHLSIYVLADKINAGPATNQTVPKMLKG